MTISKYLDEDLANGTAVRILSLTTRDGVSWAEVELAENAFAPGAYPDGVAFYPDANYVLKTGLVCSPDIWE